MIQKNPNKGSEAGNMADIKLVIKIPEEIYKNAKDGLLCGNETIVDAIKNGTPTVDAIPRSVLEEIKADIDVYLFLNEFGSDYRSDVRKIIDKHI